MTTSRSEIEAAEVVPGTLYDWKSWREGPRTLLAEYAASHGQLVWRPSEIVRGGVTRAMSVLVSSTQYFVEEVESTSHRPPQLNLRCARVDPITGPIPGSSCSVQVKLAHVIHRLKDGWESVDATLVST